MATLFLHPAAIGGRLYLAPLTAPTIVTVPPVTRPANSISAARRVKFPGGTRVVKFPGGTRIVRF